MWKISPIFVLHKLHCPPQIIRTLELTHKFWTLSFRGPVYFARPYRSTEKPHIEHTNALIHQYLLKYNSFTGLTAKEIKEIESGVSITVQERS